MDRKKVRINIHEAVTTVIGVGRNRQGAIDRKTLRDLREALRSGNWEIVPALD